jgi:hypothetical protein
MPHFQLFAFVADLPHTYKKEDTRKLLAPAFQPSPGTASVRLCPLAPIPQPAAARVKQTPSASSRPERWEASQKEFEKLGILEELND